MSEDSVEERATTNEQTGRVVEAVEKHEQVRVEDEVKRARTDKKFGREMVDRWNEIKAKIPVGTRPDWFEVAAPRLAGNRRAGRHHALSC